MTQIFGAFMARQGASGEYLKISFSPTSMPIQQRWRNNGLSADFLADYLSTLAFPIYEFGVFSCGFRVYPL